MGKHGWVTLRFEAQTTIPFEQIMAWLEESYRAIAPKRLVKSLPPQGIAPAPRQPKPPPPEPVVDQDDLAVLLVGNDTMRLERSRLALSHMDHAAIAVALGDEALDIAGAAEPRVVVLDLSRNAEDALALGPQLALLSPDGQLVIAGIRDAKQQHKVESLVSNRAMLSKEAPGAPKFLKALSALL
jgi:hypothetical protein